MKVEDEIQFSHEVKFLLFLYRGSNGCITDQNKKMYSEVWKMPFSFKGAL